MNLDPELIDAEVHYSDPERNFYYVKIIFLGIGLYITSFSVKPSKIDGQLWVERPVFRTKGGKIMSHVDFDKSSELWRIVERKALEAVEAHKAEHERPVDNELREPIISDEEIERMEKQYVKNKSVPPIGI